MCVYEREVGAGEREREYVSLSLFSNGVDVLSCLTAFSGNKIKQDKNVTVPRKNEL